MKRPTNPPESGWCSHCHQPCEGAWIDTGIGAYEYWGQRGVDTRWDAVSECCGEEITDRDPACECCGSTAHELDRYGWCFACAHDTQDITVDSVIALAV